MKKKDNVVYIDENGKVKKKFSIKETCAKAKEKAGQIWTACKENKEAVIAVGSVVIPATVEIGKTIVKGRNRRNDERRRKLEMWDPVEGHWWPLRRQLTSAEYLEVERRVKNGESRGEVLDDMGVLKTK